MTRARTARGLAVCCLLLQAACHRTEPAGFLPPDGGLPNVVLITIDTLRADHLGCYGTRFGDLTPNLDRFAAGACVFLAATTPAPATLPALASLHTGLYPGRQPIRTNIGALPTNVPVLAEILQQHGYTTAAFFGNSLLVPKSGFRRGFEQYRSFVARPPAASDASGADMALEWLGSAPRAPWFLWVHFMDPHGPYDSAPVAWSTGLEPPDPLPNRDLPVSATNYGLGMIPQYQVLAGVTQASAYRMRYRGEVRFSDAALGRVLAALDAPATRNRTVVVIAADHGESLGEHDYYFQHGWFPYEDCVHVPLLLRVPGGGARRVSQPVSLVDILPTVLAGLRFPALPGLEGRDLGPLLRGGELDDAAVFSVTAYLNQMTAIRRGHWKLVYTPPPPAPFAGDPWAGDYSPHEERALYDLGADPGETKNLYATDRARADQLWAALASWQGTHDIPIGRRTFPTPDEATRQRLEALGYGAP